LLVHALKDDEVYRFSDKTAVPGIKGEAGQQGRNLFRHKAAQYSPGLLEPCLDDFFEFTAFPFRGFLSPALAKSHAPAHKEKEKTKKQNHTQQDNYQGTEDFRSFHSLFWHAKLLFESIKNSGCFPIRKEGAMWAVYALFSALFAALTSILAKIGVENINSNLATAIRTVVVLVMAWTMVFITGAQTGLEAISRRSLLFLVLSGIATGLSWLCYYRALQMGPASRVIPIDKSSLVFGMILAFVVLKETLTIKAVIGGSLIAIGTFVLIF